MDSGGSWGGVEWGDAEVNVAPLKPLQVSWVGEEQPRLRGSELATEGERGGAVVAVDVAI